MSRRQLVREWRADLDGRPVVVQLYDTHEPHRDEGGHRRLAYRLSHDSVVVFEGEDIGVPTTDAIDSDHTLASVVTFLSMKAGDTDRAYFESYTPGQLEWAEQHGEELGFRAIELRSGHATTTERVRASASYGYPFRAVCTCGWTSMGYAAHHAAESMAADHEHQS